jgi:poly-beta-1,6-N-acetyl-D-glucosamine synthase
MSIVDPPPPVAQEEVVPHPDGGVPLAELQPGAQPNDGLLACSVGIMAYNEEANIAQTLRAVLAQKTPGLCIEEVIVVASGCTDGTASTVAAIARDEPRVRLRIQEKREGKASAINLFLKEAKTPIVVLSGADLIPETSALEYLCAPFADPTVGMVGGRPVPVNDPSTFMGHAVHLLWRLHDYLSRVQPKLGEMVAFRNVISGIPSDTAVDEMSIQALVSQLGYRVIYEPACVVYNKGPLTVEDFLKQRRRIYAGHLHVKAHQNYQAPTMRVSPIVSQLIACRHFSMSDPLRLVWTLGTIGLEGIARIQGYYDYRRRREHHIWQVVPSTKALEAGKHRVRRLSNAQSILVFRIVLEGADGFDGYPEGRDHQATEAARKLLPLMRTRMRREDKLAVNAPGIMTAVIRAEQNGAEMVARGLQAAAQAAPVRIGRRGRGVRVEVAYSFLTFAFKGRNGGVTVSSPPVHEAIAVPAQVITAEV